MGRGKRKQKREFQKKRLRQRQGSAKVQAQPRPGSPSSRVAAAQAAAQASARVSAQAKAAVRGEARSAAPAQTAEVDRAQPVRRAFGIFRVGQIDFVSKQKWFAIFSGTLLLISVLSLAFRGLNYGIDFTGGNSYALNFSQPVQEAQVRSALESAGVRGAVIRVDRTDPKEAIVRTPYLDTQAEAAMMSAVKAKLGDFQASAGDAVSPTIGGELLKDALIGTLLACLGILIYVAVRFEYRFATAGVLALVHDTLITTGLFSVFRLEVNAAYVAAILTIIGYSINDTIVVFDRIRDNLKRRGKEGLDALSNRSINETFVRSVNTSMTAFLAITAIYLFGGATTKDFSLALMVGIFFGTYSSICVATPFWLWWRKRDERRLAAETSKSVGKAKAVRG